MNLSVHQGCQVLLTIESCTPNLCWVRHIVDVIAVSGVGIKGVTDSVSFFFVHVCRGAYPVKTLNVDSGDYGDTKPNSPHLPSPTIQMLL